MPTYRSHADAAAGGTSSLVVSKPDGVIAGDVMLAWPLAAKYSGTIPTFTAPAGWSEVTTYGSTQGYRSSVYVKVAGAFEPASYTFSASVSCDQFAMSVAAFYGVNTVNPIAAAASANSSLTGTPTAPSVTPTRNGLLVGLWPWGNSTSATFDAPSPMVERYSWSFGAGAGGLATQDVSAGVPTGSKTAAGTGSRCYPHLVVLASSNQPPNAPTLTTMANGETVDQASTNRAAHEFSDSDLGDSQSAFDIRYRIIGGAWTTKYVVTPNQWYDFAAGQLVTGDYERQVRTYDSQGVVGPYCGSGFFTVADAPAAPTITDPINGQTISTAAYTAVISAPNVDAVQWRTVANNAGTADPSTVYQDSGILTTGDLRRYTFTFPVNNRVEHLQASIRYGGLWSPWADSTNPISYTQAAASTVTLSPSPETGSLAVAIVNPAPAGGQPAAAYNYVLIDDGDGYERRANMLPTNTTWTYWLPKSGREYVGNIRVGTVGTNGTSVETQA